MSSALSHAIQTPALSLGHQLMASHSNEYVLYFQHFKFSLLSLAVLIHLGRGGVFHLHFCVFNGGKLEKLCYLSPRGCLLLSFQLSSSREHRA